MARDRHAAGLATLLTAVLAVGSGAAACTGSGHGTGSHRTATGPVRAIDVDATPVADLKDGGTVTWSLDDFPTQWNVNQTDGNEESANNVMNALMPHPTVSDAHGNLSFDPDYWLSAKVVSTSPEKVEYRLNPAAKWSDGKPITVSDFQAQWRALSGGTPGFHAASTRGYDRIAAVAKGKDVFDVVVTFRKPLAEWQGLFNPLFPAAANATPKAFDTMYLKQIPLTAGPFEFGSFDNAAHTVTVLRDLHWWGANVPKLDRIVFKALAPGDRVKAYVDGAVDILWDMNLDPADYRAARRRSDGTVRAAAGPDIRQITFHGAGTGPLSDVNVRTAVAQGIDRAALAAADLSGIDWPTRTLGNHMLVATQAGYRDNSGDVGRYDPRHARQLLDEAGWSQAPGAKFRSKGGKSLMLRFTIPAGVPVSATEAGLVQKMMSAIGVDLTIVSVPQDAYFARYVDPGNFDLTAFSWLGTPFPAMVAAEIYQRNKPSNFSGIGSATLDSVLTAAANDFDRNLEYADLNAADAIVWQEVQSITLYQRPELTAVKNGIANIGVMGFATVDYTKIGYRK